SHQLLVFGHDAKHSLADLDRRTDTRVAVPAARSHPKHVRRLIAQEDHRVAESEHLVHHRKDQRQDPRQIERGDNLAADEEETAGFAVLARELAVEPIDLALHREELLARLLRGLIHGEGARNSTSFLAEMTS